LAINTRIAQLQKEGWDYRKSVSGTLVIKGTGLNALLKVSSKIRANFAVWKKGLKWLSDRCLKESGALIVGSGLR